MDVFTLQSWAGAGCAYDIYLPDVLIIVQLFLINDVKDGPLGSQACYDKCQALVT